jgi:glutamate synthase domain-containing protein 3
MENDIIELKQLVSNHMKATGSTVARQILDNWEDELRQFVKVMPTDYKRVLMQMTEEKESSAA